MSGYIYIYYTYAILARYIEYSEFQPHRCEQKKKKNLEYLGYIEIFGVKFWSAQTELKQPVGGKTAPAF